MKELKWFGGLLLIFFGLWLFGGGPERYTKENDKPFLKPPSPLDSGEVYGPVDNSVNTKVPPGWQSQATDYFTVALPPGWYYKASDSSVWNSNRGEFTNNTIVLFFEYGPYATMPVPVSDTQYLITTETIAGLPTKLIQPRVIAANTTGVFLDRGIGKEKLSIVGYNLSPAERSTAFAIFRTIEFRN